MIEKLHKSLILGQTARETFFSNITDLIRSIRLQPVHITEDLLSVLSVQSPFFETKFSFEATRAGFNLITDILNIARRLQIINSARPSSQRSLQRSLNEFLPSLLNLQTTNDTDTFGLRAHDRLLNESTEVSMDNIYSICFFNHQYAAFTASDMQKILSKHWNNLNCCLSLREEELSWRIKHGAIITPKLAFQMGLVHENKCFFCNRFNPTWRHLLICEYFVPMWDVIKNVVVTCGINWKQQIQFSGVIISRFSAVNHVVNLGYQVLFEFIMAKLNNHQLNCTPSGRLRQLLFQLLYY